MTAQNEVTICLVCVAVLTCFVDLCDGCWLRHVAFSRQSERLTTRRSTPLNSAGARGQHYRTCIWLSGWTRTNHKKKTKVIEHASQLVTFRNISASVATCSGSSNNMHVCVSAGKSTMIRVCPPTSQAATKREVFGKGGVLHCCHVPVMTKICPRNDLTMPASLFDQRPRAP